MATEFYIPKMSDHQDEAEVRAWLKVEGDFVEAGEPLLEVTTDKANVEVPAPVSGYLVAVRDGVGPGVTIPVGETVAFLVDSLDEIVTALPPFVEPSSSGPVEGVVAADAAVTDGDRPTSVGPEPSSSSEADGAIRAVPAARRRAAQIGVDLAAIVGTGPNGRITVADVEAAVAGPGPAGYLDLSPIQRMTAERMVLSAQTIPQYTLSVRIDMSAVLVARSAASGTERPSVTAYLVCVVAGLLRVFPEINGTYESGRIRINKEVAIGVAVATPGGLVVPTIRSADSKDVWAIADELRAMRDLGADGRLTPERLAAGTFTISNLGMHGIDQFTAIVNPPQTGILAVGQIGGTTSSHGTGDRIMWATLSLDHRSVDGQRGAAFLSAIKTALETYAASGRSDLDSA